MEDFSDSATCIGETQEGLYVSNDTAAGELPLSGFESSGSMDAVELYGSPTQYEQYQTTTTEIPFDQTLPGSETSYNVFPTYSEQQSQLFETQTSVSVTDYETYSTGQTYDASQTMVYAVPQFTSDQGSVASGLFQSYQITDTAYTTPTPAAVDGPPFQSAQVLTSQSTYTVQPAQSYHLDASTIAAQPGQVPVYTQPLLQTQGNYQPVGYQQILQVAPDGQHYYVQAPVPAQQPGIYQMNPNTLQAQPLTLQLQFAKPKILRRETASQAKEATIKFSKQAYAKSKEFITNKDGARAVAKQTWKQGKNLTIKTTDMLDKYVRPLMPFIAMQDMELAMALRAAQGVGHGLKGPGGGVQRRPVGGGGQGVQQMDAAALANLTQVLTLLQASGGNVGGMGGGGGGQMDEGQARLLAALLQMQQQQTGQTQVYPQPQQARQFDVQINAQGQGQQTSESRMQQQRHVHPVKPPAQQIMHPQIQRQVQQQQERIQQRPPNAEFQQLHQQTLQHQVQQQVQPAQSQQYQFQSEELHTMYPPTSGSQIQQRQQSLSGGNGQPYDGHQQQPHYEHNHQLRQQQPANDQLQHSTFHVQQQQQQFHSPTQQAHLQQQHLTVPVSQTRPQRKPVGSGPGSASPAISAIQSTQTHAQPPSSPSPVLHQHIQSEPLKDLESSLANLSMHTQPQVASSQAVAQQSQPAS